MFFSPINDAHDEPTLSRQRMNGMIGAQCAGPRAVSPLLPVTRNAAQRAGSCGGGASLCLEAPMSAPPRPHLTLVTVRRPQQRPQQPQQQQRARELRGVVNDLVPANNNNYNGRAA